MYSATCTVLAQLLKIHMCIMYRKIYIILNILYYYVEKEQNILIVVKYTVNEIDRVKCLAHYSHSINDYFLLLFHFL
jgi:hypothetical protein